ncbi:MAG: DUF3024 domain-containing protein [Xanthobacteraceae bacterium]|nr:DUF3024 domain-containing protein [Xanthobacteraceae bacterium]
MAFTELERKRCEKAAARFIEQRRPPPRIRAKLDIAFRVQGQSIEIFSVRPHWQDKSKIAEEPIAKATYNRKKKVWKVFWQRADLKWHPYQPHPEARTIEDFLTIVDDDEYCCFFG